MTFWDVMAKDLQDQAGAGADTEDGALERISTSGVMLFALIS